MSDPSQDDWKRLSCEVQTLQKRGNHPNIIPLLASYTLDTVESGSDVKILCLLFPLAEMDLAVWMNKPQPPDNVVGLSKEGRQMYIYRFIYELVSGVSYLHREVDGEVTAHYDLKPRNILLVDNRLKIGDFGHSHLRPILEGSATNRASGLGTYEYQPPEYYKEDGSRAQIKHGRAFDVWATGCILIELATLVVYGWQSQMITKFRDERKRNPNRDRRSPPSVRAGSDVSFHNNMTVVKDWISRLKKRDGSQQLNEVLDIAAGMLAPKPENRLYMWEVQTDLYKTLAPYVKSLPELEGDLCVAPMLTHRYPMSHYPASYIEDGTDTPLHRAARTNNRERTIRLWELGWSISLPDGNGDTPREIMKRSNNNGLRTLEDDVTKMLEAAKTGNIGDLEKLFSRGLTPLMVDPNGRSALYEATMSSQIEVIEFLLKNRKAEQLMLCTNGPDGPELPLHTAARLGLVRALDRLLDYYPDVNVCSSNFQTALWYGTKSCHADVVRLLLKNKARVLPPQVPDYKPVNTPLHAARRGDIMNLLVQADGHECIERKNACGMTPLLEAVNNDSVSSFEILLQHGASIHAVSHGEMNVLRYITLYGRHDLLRLCIEKFSLEELEHRRHGKTLLEEARENGHKEVAQLLKSHIRQRRSGGSGSGDSGFIPRIFTKLHIR